MTDMKESRLTVTVNADLRRRLSAAAKKSGKREQDLVRETLEKEFPRVTPKQSALDRALALGIVGMIEGGPDDMSTNPKYLEGFGEA